MNTSPERLERLVADAARLAAPEEVTGLLGGTDEALIAATVRVETLGRIVDALRVRTTAEVARRSSRWLGAQGLAASYGYRTAEELLEQVTGASVRTVRRRVRLAEQVAPREGSLGAVLPPLFAHVADAFGAGRIGLDTVEAIASGLAPTRHRADEEDIVAAEATLVAHATGQANALDGTTGTDTEASLDEAGVPAELMGTPASPLSADLIRDQARLWRDFLDPNGARPREELARRRRSFGVSRTPREDGLHSVFGGLTPDVAAAFQAAADSTITVHTGPVFIPTDKTSLDDGTGHRTEDDAAGDGADLAVPEERTPDQQRHDLFAGMIRAYTAAVHLAVPAGEAGQPSGPGATDRTADLGPVRTPAPAIIMIEVDQLDDFHGAGTITGIDGRVPASYLAQAACDAGIQVLVKKHGAAVRLGTAGRFFTQNQRKAIAARDGTTCLIPGCRVPYHALEAHHVNPHRRHGPTHVNNGVLLCWWHHHLIDTGTWHIQMRHSRPHVTINARTYLPRAA